MQKQFKLFIFFVAYIFVISINYQTKAQTGPPVLFFSDLTSGPNTGGQQNLGAFITIYGEGFGSARSNSTVTIDGHEVAKYVIWGEDNAPARDLDLIVFQPGPNVTSGDIILTVNGRASNPLPFTVRSGEIYFVIPGAPNTNDTNPGTYAAPFKTLYRPRQSLQPGDIVYIKGGTFSTADPMFINMASGDFRLKENSPAIDAGISTGITNDYFGLPRDTKYDIGAYEYAVTVAVKKRENQSGLPRDFNLKQNFPNPFNPQTTIGFSLHRLSHV